MFKSVGTIEDKMVGASLAAVNLLLPFSEGIERLIFINFKNGNVIYGTPRFSITGSSCFSCSNRFSDAGYYAEYGLTNHAAA